MLTIEEFGWMAYRIISLWGLLYTILQLLAFLKLLQNLQGQLSNILLDCLKN